MMNAFLAERLNDRMATYMHLHIHQRHIPGAVVHVSFRGRTLVHSAFGYRQVYPQPEKMSLNTVFDLASLTKVVVTLPATLLLLHQGALQLEDAVQKHIPEFKGAGKDKITLRHCLTHTAGLMAHRLYAENGLGKGAILEQIYSEDLMHIPGKRVVYSDLGLILVGEIIERVTGEPFDRWTKREIFQQLDMSESSFVPQLPAERFAATEYCPRLDTYKVGIVHDENAQVMGGTGGHAGLFSTVKDLSRFARMIENQGRHGDQIFLPPSLIERSVRNHTPFDTVSRGLGWLLKAGDNASPFGLSCSDSTFGHTGFTGTSIMFDPQRKLHVIVLTNRVHYGREPDFNAFRADLHDLIIRTLEQAEQTDNE